MGEYRRIGRKLEHKGKIVSFYTDTMELPDGRTAEWDFLDHHGAAAMVAVLPGDKILLVKQYRNAPERETLEIPAGGKNPGEDPKTCAIRELEEETGYRPVGEVPLLLELYTTVAFCNEKISIYYSDALTPGQLHLDPDEFLHVVPMDLKEACEKIMTGEIQDAKTIGAILAYCRLKNK